MHSFLIAATFIAILLAPCVTAQFSGQDTRRRRPRARLTVRIPVAKAKLAEVEDPWSSSMQHQRAEILRSKRTRGLKRIHVPAEIVRSSGSRTSLAGIR